MASDFIDTQMSISMTPTEAHDFIKKLAADDHFRAEIERKPRETLAQHGINLPVDQITTGAILPSKNALTRALANFREFGEIDFATMSSPSGWPFMVFWWLYMTPAKPRRGQEGESVNVKWR
jgi:hypothetical protein